ncbi:iron chelate uptake ABC transporter family permease subunit [Ensifer sp. T173]|uniref:Iron chelate uptake ABC transporter family permease subunit n=1 Tax=Ensifer canadensis TaxID=555315 RepID=A0AAW4FL66_9HYPH|nr:MULTISPECIES: iron ABC transporter permease [Ensifer]KQW55686.1 iron-siderophore ABC transporter permease [Ensifer sp. Root127]MBM3092802.1 iron chelate uptake ABC transporter family permease subunit [Ensifer canadensis]NOV19945.1 iron ABC transporter permease [Ensifer canadensis]UBI79756.1 iron ABC transporter permease [Ensifer canadensis]
MAIEAATTESTGRDLYRALAFRRIAILSLLVIALCFSISLDMALGPANYPLSDVLSAMLDPAAVAQQLRVIVWDIRMPIALMAVTVGASLSVAGAQMQTILSNPLASPFTLGISAAASFGAALALVGGVALFPAAIQYMVPLNAFLMAMVAALFIHFASTMRGVSVETIVLLGIALVFTFNAALSLLEYLASEQALAAVVFWTMGSLTKATWPKVYFTGAILVAMVPFLMKDAWALTALRLGDDKAASMGVNVRRLRLQTMMIVSLLAAIPVSFVGTIGFVGLVGPHIARMLVGEDQRFFLPGSVICGALLLSATSVVSKMIIPGAILPIGVITALIGVPFFFVLIFSNRRRAW